MTTYKGSSIKSGLVKGPLSVDKQLVSEYIKEYFPYLIAIGYDDN